MVTQAARQVKGRLANRRPPPHTLAMDTNVAPPTLPAVTDPIHLFQDWLAEATASEPNDPNAFAVATATPDGRPSVRMVLLKGVDARGFVFYTNGESRKGTELAANPHVAMLFHWKTLRPPGPRRRCGCARERGGVGRLLQLPRPYL